MSSRYRTSTVVGELTIGILCGFAAVSAAQAPPPGDLDLTFSLVANSDTSIPGPLAAGTFAAFGNWPAIDDQGNVLFCGTGGVDAIGKTQEGIYVANGAVVVVADKNTPVPGGATTFTGFGDGSCTGRHSIDGGRVAFLANTITPGTALGLFTNADGDTLETVTLTSTAVGDFDRLYAPSVAGQLVAFHGLRVAAPGISQGELVIFDAVTNSFTTVDLGDVSCPDCVIYGNVNPFMGGSSVAVGRGATGTAELIVANDVVDPVMATGVTSVPGKPSSWFTAIPNYPVLDSGGEGIAFHGFLSDRTSGVYKRVGGPLLRVADDTIPIPGGLPLGTEATFSSLADGYVSIANGSVAFLAFALGGHRGIYTDLDGVLRRIVATGETILVDGVPYVPNALEFGSEGFSLTPDGYSLVFRAVELGAGRQSIIRADVGVRTPEADLGVALRDLDDPVVAGETIEYEATVTNDGPDPAADVLLVDTLPGGVDLLSAEPTQGACDPSGDQVLCALGQIEVGSDVQVTVRVDAPVAGLFSNEVAVSSGTADPEPGNDEDVEQTTVNAAPTPEADLEVTQVDAVDPVTEGDLVRYAVTVTNRGPSPAAGVVLVDTLPPGVGLESLDVTQGACSGEGVITCVIGDLDPSAASVVTIGVRALEPGTLENRAEANSETQDPEPSNDLAVEQTTIVAAPTPLADLDVTMVDSVDPVTEGDAVRYVLTVTNRGPSPAVATVLTDILPNGVTLDSIEATQGACSADGNAVTCAVGDLAPAAGAVVAVGVTTLEPGVLANQAAVSSMTEDPEPSNNQTAEQTTVEAAPQADLELRMVDAPDPVTEGETVRYTVTVFNFGPDRAADVALTHRLSSDTTLDLVDVSQGTCSAGGGGITCALGDLDAGSAATLTVAVTALEPGNLLSQAEVTSLTADPLPTNNQIVEETTVIAAPEAQADLEVSVVDEPDPVVRGEIVRYSVSVVNHGPDTAEEVVLTDRVPNVRSWTADAGSCAATAPGLVCSLGDIASGGGVVVTVDVQAEHPRRVTNAAAVSTTTRDEDPRNDRALELTRVVQPQADLSVAIVGEPSPAFVGDTVRYSVTVTNNGPGTAEDVVLTDAVVELLSVSPLRPGSWSADRGSCELQLSELICQLGELARGASATVVVEIEARERGLIGSQARVATSTLDPVPRNNRTFERTRVIEPQADLSVAISDDPDPVSIGGVVQYSVAVTNNGVFTAEGVVLTDIALNIVSWAADAPCVLEQQLTCKLGDLPPGGSTVVTVDVEARRRRDVVNLARVLSSTPEDHPADNVAVERTTVTAPPGLGGG